MVEGDEEKLAFIFRDGQFSPPTREPGYLKYFMQDILLKRIRKDTNFYLEKIIVYTQNGSNHADEVNSILEILSKHPLVEKQ